MAEKPEEPITDMFAVEDESERSKVPDSATPEIEPPPEKEERERNPDGTFKGEKPKEKEEKGEDKPKEEEKPKVEKKDETVPLAKFLDERNKLKAELEQRDLTLKQFQEKLAALEAKLPKPEEPPEPDFVEDPKAYVDAKMAATLAKLEAANKAATEQGKKAEETAAGAREQIELQQFMANVQSHEQRFMVEHPDYHDALAHVRQIRAYQLEQFEPGITQEQIVEVIRREEIQLAAQLARAGKDPVSTAYELAKRYGYQPKQKEAPKGNGAAAPPPAGGRAQLPPDQSLGGGGGAPDTHVDEEEQDNVDKALASLFRRRA